MVAALFVRALHQYDIHPGGGYGLINTALEMLGGPTLTLDILESTDTWSWMHGALVENTQVWMEIGKGQPDLYAETGFLMMASLWHPPREKPPASSLALSLADPVLEPPRRLFFYCGRF